MSARAEKPSPKRPKRAASAPVAPAAKKKAAPPREKIGSRDRLLAAAEVEFAAHGLRGARVQAIVDRAGVNERMLYHHFGDKDGLYRAVILRFAAEITPGLEAALDAPGADALARLGGMLRSYFDALFTHPNIVRLSLHEILAGWPSLSRFESDDDHRLSLKIFAFFNEAREAGVIRADLDPRAAMVAAGSTFLMIPVALPRLQRFYGEDLGDPAAIAALREQIVDTLLHGFVAHPKARR
jgi:AcrR family transcriptional regulator